MLDSNGSRQPSLMIIRRLMSGSDRCAWIDSLECADRLPVIDSFLRKTPQHTLITTQNTTDMSDIEVRDEDPNFVYQRIMLRITDRSGDKSLEQATCPLH